MKKLLFTTVIIFLTFVFFSCEKDISEEIFNEVQLKSANKGNEKLNGFDQWGYNWNAHHFNGYLINAVMGDNLYDIFPFHKWEGGPYLGEGDIFIDSFVNAWGVFPIDSILLDCKLVMHWNDALISKDGTYPVIFGDYSNWEDSNGWITFHYKMDKGNEKWSSFQKLVAKRTSDVLDNGIWYDKNGNEIGLATYDWPTLILVKKENIGNVPAMFMDSYNSPLASGLGSYKSK